MGTDQGMGSRVSIKNSYVTLHLEIKVILSISLIYICVIVSFINLVEFSCTNILKYDLHHANTFYCIFFVSRD